MAAVCAYMRSLLLLRDSSDNRIIYICTDINETKILNAANQFISLGLADAGYQYVNIDVSVPILHFCRLSVRTPVDATTRMTGLLATRQPKRHHGQDRPRPEQVPQRDQWCRRPSALPRAQIRNIQVRNHSRYICIF